MWAREGFSRQGLHESVWAQSPWSRYFRICVEALRAGGHRAAASWQLRQVVLGMTPATFAAIRPHLPLFGPPQPSLASADPFAAAALASAARAEPVLSANQPQPDCASEINTERIRSTAEECCVLTEQKQKIQLRRRSVVTT